MHWKGVFHTCKEIWNTKINNYSIGTSIASRSLGSETRFNYLQTRKMENY